MSRPDSRADLKAIAVPTTIIVGDSDQITPPDTAAEMAAGIADAELVVIETAGHLALLEQPDAVNAALAQWLGV
jgi:pimeloyl-ACP methyl ester carboxylesterase